jgi:hypothetical protein
MKSNHAFALTMLVAVGAMSLSQAQQSAAVTDEQAVTALEMQWLKADQTNNGDLAAPLMADRYFSVSFTGAIEDKAQTLADFKARRYSSAEYEDGVKVVVLGNTAVARGTYIGSGTDGGKQFHEHLRWTDTWVKTDGKWVCLASHYSKV